MKLRSRPELQGTLSKLIYFLKREKERRERETSTVLPMSSGGHSGKASNIKPILFLLFFSFFYCLIFFSPSNS